jgi:retinol dehydrogenase-14
MMANMGRDCLQPMAGRTVLVTGGGSRGIGKATALGLPTMGAHVAITGRDRTRTGTRPAKSTQPPVGG